MTGVTSLGMTEAASLRMTGVTSLGMTEAASLRMTGVASLVMTLYVILNNYPMSY